MEKIVIGHIDNKRKINKRISIVFILLILVICFIFFDTFEALAFIGITTILLGVIKYIYSLNSTILGVNEQDPLVVLEISETAISYVDKRDNQNLFMLYLKDIDKIRLGYRQRWFRMQHVFDLKLDFLINDGSLYTLYSEGILSKQGDYQKAIDYLETKNITIYDPQNIRPLLSMNSIDFQFALRQRLWNGDLK